MLNNVKAIEAIGILLNEQFSLTIRLFEIRKFMKY